MNDNNVLQTSIKLLTAFGFLLTVNNYANAAESIGDTRKVVNSVTGTVSGTKRRLGRGDPVFRKERIVAGTNSSAQMVFNDGTRFAVGAGASAVLDRFVYSGSALTGKVVLKTARGAFRFVTGKLPSRSYKIVTPASTIGVRGTIIDGYVGRGGETIVVLLSGATDVCNRRGRCRSLTKRCDAVRVDPSGRFTTGRGFSRDILGSNPFGLAAFFLRNQRQLIRSMHAPQHTVRTCLGANQGTRSGGDKRGPRRFWK